MSPLKPVNVRMDSEIIAALKVIKERDGMPISEQIRRALLAWAKSRKVAIKQGTKR